MTGEIDVEGRLLLVSYYAPTRAHAGGLRILDMYSLIKEQRPNVQLDLFTHHRPEIDWDLDDVYDIFDNVYLSPTEDLSKSALNAFCGVEEVYDVIDLQFHPTGFNIGEYRTLGNKVLFTPMESMVKCFYLNVRPWQLMKDKTSLRDLREQWRSASEEISFVKNADMTVCVSETDAEFLSTFTPSEKVLGIDTGISQLEFKNSISDDFATPPFETRQLNVLFVAYFGSMTNIEALQWYLNNVHPAIKKAIPDYKITVVGRGDLSSFENLDDDSIDLVGEVPSLEKYIQKASLGIAPALSGSGFRGKINQYALMGIPTVASTIATKGFPYKDGTEILMARTPEEFSNACIKLLQDQKLNDSMGKAARKVCLENFTWHSKWEEIEALYELNHEDVDEVSPLISVLVPSYNHGKYIKKRIQSILGQTYNNIELFVIDDCSEDDSHEIISRMQKKHGFTYISREKNSGTPFAAWADICELASGDYIWICESDDIALPNFLEEAVNHMLAKPDAAFFYCNSEIIDEKGKVIGNTIDHYHEIWNDNRWDYDFTSLGVTELTNFQLRGQIVPNMSSALFSTEVFKKAYVPFVNKLRLTGDWLFVGRALEHGMSIFSNKSLSCFREHEVTSRVRVKSARSQAEFILTKYHLFRVAKQPLSAFAATMSNDVIRFLYEPVNWLSVTKALLQVSIRSTFGFAVLLGASVLINPAYLTKFGERRKHAKKWKLENEEAQ